MDLNSIPQEQTDNFPTGVSEVETDSRLEMLSFIRGLDYAGVPHGNPFHRIYKVVVRVRNVEDRKIMVVSNSAGTWGKGDTLREALAQAKQPLHYELWIVHPDAYVSAAGDIISPCEDWATLKKIKDEGEFD